MQRRKFLVGIGSLAAGGAAATGTGAFSFAQTDRDISLEVVPDRAAYFTFEQGNENGEYADVNADGKLVLNIDDNADVGGGGLNPDSVYLFDDIARIRNQGNQEIEVSVPDTTSDGFWSTNFVVYVGDGNGTNSGNRQSIWPKDGKTGDFDKRLNGRAGVDSLDDLIDTSPSSFTLSSGSGVKFGVALAAPDSPTSENTGITLRAEET